MSPISLLRRPTILVVVSMVPSIAMAQSGAQGSAPADAPTIGPPIRRISTASAVSTEPLGSINSVIELRDGRVLLNDVTRRRLLLMDTTLKVTEVVLDSIAGVANAYGTRGMLIPYRGDSILFVEPTTYSMVLLDPDARIARVRSVWRTQDVPTVASPTNTYGFPATDAKGRVVYHVAAIPAPPKVAPPPGVPYFPTPPDSAFIVAVDIDTRKIDTIGSIRIPKASFVVKTTAENYFGFYTVTNPMPSTDEWAVLPNGVVAFVRGRDYRIEYLHQDGRLTSSAKIPFDWQRMTEELKHALVDSVKSANQRNLTRSYTTSMIRWANTFNKPYPANFTIPDWFVVPQGLPKDWKFPSGVKFPDDYIYACPPGVEPTVAGAPNAPGAAAPTPAGSPAGGPPAGRPSCIPSPVMLGGGSAPPPPTLSEALVMPASELPDYRPPFARGAVRADADGNLWVLTIPPKPNTGGPVYDIINPTGELVDRVQLPANYSLAGFGKGKVVFVSMRDANGLHLARVRLR